LWSIARFDLGLRWKEFEELTPEMFTALCKRRNIRFKYERYANALTASAVYNCNRASADAPILTAFDFVKEDNPEREHTEEIKRLIKQVVVFMPPSTTREKFLEVKDRTIASLTAQGRADAAELWHECWPTL
jgi:hypothetical protein